ncbi:MAG: peptide-methionine (S)-S-oxide reductase [Chloroflexi bacterium RBG_13_50_10]|nr:MAG: peptide-methionine (S)-S-oxide reductase [Chloroflexi bacterium RBG_13_50_10]
MKRNNGKETATLAGGCFWCLEAVFNEVEGVEKAVSGYSGGKVVNPSYNEVCAGTTGHAEAVQLTFDPKIISFKQILQIFFSVHDPTTLNRQGADVGTQYRSAIFCHDQEQKKTAEQVIKELNDKHVWGSLIVTEVTAFRNFYPAEDYHREYFERNPEQPYCRIVIAPKLAKFRKQYLGKNK